MYKLISIDIDGTLLNSYNKITQRTYDCLVKASNKGVVIVLSSARPLNIILKLINKARLTSYINFVVGVNGAFIYDIQDSRLLLSTYLSYDDILYITSKLEKNCTYYCFSNSEIYVVDDFISKYCFYESELFEIPINRLSLNDLASKSITKITIPDDCKSIISKLNSISINLSSKYNVMQTGKNYIEIFDKNCSKGLALKFIAEKFNFSKESIIAIGDQKNDIDMIKYAGLGVAMENASEELKMHARLFTKSNDNDGVAEIIQSYLLKDIL